MAQQRIGYIDIAKCIAIAFIIIGHMGIVFSSANTAGGMPPEMVKFAFTFHLSVFFLASGYFFSETKAFSIDFIKKDAKTLLVPYLLTALFIIIGCMATATYHGLSPTDELIRWSQAAIWGAGATSEVALWNVERIGGIWFLWAMFWAHIALVATSKMGEWTRLATLSSLTAIVVLSANYVWLPFSIQSGLGCAVLLYVGILARKHNMFDKGSIPILAFVIFIAIWTYAIINGGGMSLAMQHYPLGFVDAIAGIAAAAIIFTVSRKIEEYIEPLSTFMQWIGRNTLPIFCMHIVEDNMFYWWEIGPWFSNMFGQWEFTWIVVLLLRFAIDTLLVALMYSLPGIRNIYFPQIVKTKASGDASAIALNNTWWKYVGIGTFTCLVLLTVVMFFV